MRCTGLRLVASSIRHAESATGVASAGRNAGVHLRLCILPARVVAARLPRPLAAFSCHAMSCIRAINVQLGRFPTGARCLGIARKEYELCGIFYAARFSCGSSYRLRRKNTGARRKPAEPNLVTPLPRTADGRPDLQGIWTNDTFTPLERPKGFADKVFFAEAEEAVWEVAG